ncbi:Uncharacterized protein QTN25_009716 [Entamoeba marina]
MKKIYAYLIKFGAPTLITVAAVFCAISLFSYCFGMPYHTFDKSTNTSLINDNSDEHSCDALKYSHALSYHLGENTYQYQCGYSILSDILTFIVEILCVAVAVCAWVFVIVWRKKKIVTFIVFCCMIIPILTQFYLVYSHCSEINKGRKACNQAEDLYGAHCSILPFIFTPILDIWTFLFFIGAMVLTGMLYFLRPLIKRTLKKEGGDYQQDLDEKDSKKKKKEEEDDEDVIKDIKKTVSKAAVSGIIDFAKMGK